MAKFQFDLALAPSLSAYDSDNPTQATEELSIALHNYLAALDTANYQVCDGIPDYSVTGAVLENIRGNTEAVFTYAKTAIEGWRESETPGIETPDSNDLYTPTTTGYAWLDAIQISHYNFCYKVLFTIWIKDYIRDMLLAWPLQDISIDLAEDSGSQLRIYPTWKNLET
jgi:hypothetical protein